MASSPLSSAVADTSPSSAATYTHVPFHEENLQRALAAAAFAEESLFKSISSPAAGAEPFADAGALRVNPETLTRPSVMLRQRAAAARRVESGQAPEDGDANALRETTESAEMEDSIGSDAPDTDTDNETMGELFTLLFNAPVAAPAAAARRWSGVRSKMNAIAAFKPIALSVAAQAAPVAASRSPPPPPLPPRDLDTRAGFHDLDTRAGFHDLDTRAGFHSPELSSPEPPPLPPSRGHPPPQPLSSGGGARDDERSPPRHPSPIPIVLSPIPSVHDAALLRASAAAAGVRPRALLPPAADAEAATLESPAASDAPRLTALATK